MYVHFLFGMAYVFYSWSYFPLILQSPLPPLPPSPTPSTPAAMSAKASSSLTSYSAEDTLTEEEDETAECILDFPREKLNIVENLGCGYFGDVHLCEVDRFPGYDDVFRNTDSDLVVVKSLKPGSSNALRWVDLTVYVHAYVCAGVYLLRAIFLTLSTFSRNLFFFLFFSSSRHQNRIKLRSKRSIIIASNDRYDLINNKRYSLSSKSVSLINHGK